MEENKFNNYTLTDKEIEKIIESFGEIIQNMSYINGKFSEDCEQEIKTAIHKTLSKNRKKSKN